MHRQKIQNATSLFYAPKVQGTGDFFVIEMATMNEMPHSVYWFLEQVDRDLYDRCSFYLNAQHLIQEIQKLIGGLFIRSLSRVQCGLPSSAIYFGICRSA
jgi:hypothetical protein